MNTGDSFWLSFLFRTTDNGVIFVNADGTITQMNPAAGAMLRLQPAECVGRPYAEAFEGKRALIALLSGSGDGQITVDLPKKRIAFGFANSAPDGGRVALLQDVTERQDLEGRREALTRSIAHDLNNPISAVLGFTTLARRMGELNADQERYLKRINQTVSKISGLLQSLIDLAWIEAGMPLAHRPFEMSNLIQGAVTDLVPLAREKRSAIAVAIQEPLPSIMGDPTRIKQVIYNLLHNGLTYAEEGKTVAIHAWHSGDQVLCSVADRGFGIREDELERVFERLFRSSDDAVREIPGGGIGLTFARVVVRRHGGDIWAESTYGVGSTFTFRMPISDQNY